MDHSQCLSDKALKPWAIVEPDGTVVTALCDCMAGIGETCTHIAALLFAVDASVRLRDSRTPTMLPASWVIPSSTSRDAMYTECSKIDFTSSSTRKRKFDATFDGTTVKENSKRKTNNVTVPTRKDIEAFFDSIQSSKTGVMPAVLSLVPKYAAEYKAAASQQNKLPAFLGALEDEACQHMHIQDLLEHCESINICVSKEEAAYGEQQTKGQAKCKTWTRLRTGRVTASKAYQVCHTNPSQPSMSLIHDICTPKVSRKGTASMRWGIENEKKAQDLYVKRMIEQGCHQHFRFEQCGFFINPPVPFLWSFP